MSISTRHNNPVYPRPEAKYIDVGQDGAAYTGPVASQVTQTGTINPLVGLVAQGVGEKERIGLTISIKSIAYRFEIDLSAGSQLACNGRVMLIWDKQPNGNIPPVATVLQFADYLSMMNIGQKDRFVVLRNDMFSLNPNGNSTMYFEGYVKINMNSQYAGSTGMPISGQPIILFIADNPTTTEPLLSGVWRVRYYDP